MPPKTHFITILLKSLLKASIAFLLGCAFSIFSVVWAMHLFKDNFIGMPGIGGHGGGLVLLLGLILLPLILFKLEPWSAGLLFTSLLLPIFYAFLSWKIGVGTLLQLIYSDYLGASLRSFADASSASLSRHLDVIKKSKHVQALSDFQKKVLYWIFKKIPSDSDSRKELELKFEDKIDHPSRLARRMYLMVFVLHVTLFVLASWMDHS